MIVVRALLHVFGCNPGEVFALSPEQFETEMKRAGPRRVEVVEQLAAPAVAVEEPAPAVLDEVVEEKNREAAPKRRRG